MRERKESTHLTKAGLMVRAIQRTVWLMPYVLPSDSLFGAANLTSIVFRLGTCQWISRLQKKCCCLRENHTSDPVKHHNNPNAQPKDRITGGC